MNLSRRGFLEGLASFVGAASVELRPWAPAISLSVPEGCFEPEDDDVVFDLYQTVCHTSELTHAKTQVEIYPRHGRFYPKGVAFFGRSREVVLESVRVGDMEHLLAPLDAGVFIPGVGYKIPLHMPGYPVDWASFSKKRPLVLTASPIGGPRKFAMTITGKHEGLLECGLGQKFAP